MSRHITSRAQVSGYRFGVHRAEHALVRRDVRMTHDPMRAHSRSLLAGVVLAVLALAGAGIYGVIRPQPTVGDAKVVIAEQGGMFILLDDVMHPVTDLASARLVLGEPAAPRTVSADSLRNYPRGPMVGLPGAPSTLSGNATPQRSVWTVCDGPEGTTVIAGDLDIGGSSSGRSVLVEHAGQIWLLYLRPGPGGTDVPVRARVSLDSPEVVRALGLGDAVPRPVSAGLLNAFPAEPPLEVPDVVGRGSPGPLGAVVGSVVSSSAVDGATAYHVVLSGGVQPVSAPVAEMMRLADPTADAEVRRVAPGAVAGVPQRQDLAVDHFPVRTPTMVDDHATVLCRSWQRGADDAFAVATLVSGTELPLPDGAQPVRLVGADGAGPGLDAVYLRPGTGEHIRVTGVEADSPRASTGFYVADSGVRYRLANADVAQILGLEEPGRAPWPVISLLPAGPELSREAAAVTRDAATPDAAR